MTRIELDNLTRHFPRQPDLTLRGISLDVAPGQLLALLGPSGSGKSTILKLIAGIDQPDSGDICFDGRSILKVPANQRGAVMMFQKAYLFPFMTVADNIAFGLKVQNQSKKMIQAEVARMLELVELPGVERKYPNQMSGGEQQRIALARALVTGPRVLMLDEPLSSLDTTVRLTLQEVIRRIQRELEITTILVTHDLQEAITMADRVALLLDGCIEACEPPQKLFQRPPTQAAAAFVGISTFLEGTLSREEFTTEFGRLRVCADNLLSNAEAPRPATFAIRPEALQLSKTAVENSVPATVRDLVYKGEFTDYQLTAHECTLRVRNYTIPMCEPGDKVHVQLPAKQLFELH